MLELGGYLAFTISLGITLGIDVMVTTISRFRREGLTFLNWALSLAGTHAGLPAAGYFIFWVIGNGAPALHSLLSFLGFLFTTAVVYEMLCEALGTEPKFSVTTKLSHVLRIDKVRAKHVAVVLSVSWDSLAFGLGLMPITQSGGWSTIMVVSAFVIFGVIVGLMAAGSLIVAKKLRERNFSDPKKLAVLNLAGTACEMAVIEGFAINLLWSIFSNSNSVSLSILMSGCLTLAILSTKASTLWREAMEEAVESVKG